MAEEKMVMSYEQWRDGSGVSPMQNAIFGGCDKVYAGPDPRIAVLAHVLRSNPELNKAGGVQDNGDDFDFITDVLSLRSRCLNHALLENINLREKVRRAQQGENSARQLADSLALTQKPTASLAPDLLKERDALRNELITARRERNQARADRDAMHRDWENSIRVTGCLETDIADARALLQEQKALRQAEAEMVVKLRAELAAHRAPSKVKEETVPWAYTRAAWER